jgi:hypothetical protein
VSVETEYGAIEKKLRRIEDEVKHSPLDADQRAALMTMAAARLMGTAGAMMAAASDARAGRKFNPSDHNIAEWTKITAEEVSRIVLRGSVN